jgi:hypothetical protein
MQLENKETKSREERGRRQKENNCNYMQCEKFKG